MKTPFDIERKRDTLAKTNRYKDLKKLYSKKLPTIPNLNTPLFWDKRNSERINMRKENPMSFDKYTKVSKKLPKNKAILNIGAGSGNLEEHYFSKSTTSQWYGTDISPKSISKLKAKYPYAHFKKCPVTKLAFKNKMFEFVTILDVLEHIPPSQLFKSLSEIKRVLKKGGKLIISVPLNEGLEEMVEKGRNPNAHVRIYTPDILEAELSIAGLDILEKEYLYAFGKHYHAKTVIVKRILKSYREPNLVIVTAELRR